MKKHNQSIQKFSHKNDTEELVELGQFLRDKFPQIKVKRECYLFYDNNYKYIGKKEYVPIGCRYRYRCPDLMIINKDTHELLCCVELDGKIHDIHLNETLERNELYKELKIDLVIINKAKFRVNVFDDYYNECERLIREKLG